ncbi:MAG: hypothetical protein ACI8YQ_002233 [Polaribacter sp.]
MSKRKQKIMGRNFSAIVIKSNRQNHQIHIKKLLTIIKRSFIEDKTNVKLEDALKNIEGRPSERLIVIYDNEQAIKIKDLTELIEPKEVQMISQDLSTEVLRATNSDTAGISNVLLYQNGELIREKTIGGNWESLELMQKYIPNATEKDLKAPEVGAITKYELNGSGAIRVLDEFEKGLISPNEYYTMLATVYKVKIK